MMLFKKVLATLVTIGAMTAAGSANATLTNWFLDSDGAGANAPLQVADYIDLNGRSYVHNTFTDATNFTFDEAGSFLSVLADSTNVINPFLSSTFTGSGSGTTGGTLAFLDGTLTVMSGATTIGIFDLVTGSANLFANSTLPNGTVSIIFQATSLTAGYFFDSAMNDLSDVVNAPGGLLFGFATTNAIDLSPAVVDANLLTIYNGVFEPDLVGPIISNQTTDLLISNNGQYRLEVAVPEPASLALMGIALFGLAALRRRREVN